MNTRVDTFILRLLFLNRYFPLEILFFLLFVCVLMSVYLHVCECVCVHGHGVLRLGRNP